MSANRPSLAWLPVALALVHAVAAGCWCRVCAGPTEYEVKAAFVYNFAKFVEWPPVCFATPEAPLTICVLGEDPFGTALDAIAKETVDGRRIIVKRARALAETDGCHILFVSASEAENLSNILHTVRNRPVLTIGDQRNFAQSGGVINLISVDDKIGFEINATAAERDSLKISSKLLRLGRVVK